MIRRRLYATLVLAFVVGLGLVGTALADALVFDDSGFDYSDVDLKTAYVSLATTADGGLLVVFSSEAPESYIGTIDVDDQVLEHETDNYFVDGEIRAAHDSAAMFDDVAIDYRTGYQGVTLTHGSPSFETVVGAYVAALEGLGFGIRDLAGSAGNTAVFRVATSAGDLRLVITRHGGGARVHLAPWPAARA